MGQTTAETVKEIEQTRERLAGSISELEDRLPAAARVARRTVLGGGASAGMAWFVIRRVRARARRRREEERPAPVRAVVQMIPPEWSDRIGRAMSEVSPDDARRWGMAAAGVWLAVKGAELRRLRALNRTLMSR